MPQTQTTLPSSYMNWNYYIRFCSLVFAKSGPEVIKLFSCSTQMSMKFSLLINMKMPTKVGIFIFIGRDNFMLSYILQEKIVVVINLRFICRPELSMKKVYNPWPCFFFIILYSYRELQIRGL